MAERDANQLAGPRWPAVQHDVADTSTSPQRDANQLAADVRKALITLNVATDWQRRHRKVGIAALDELVALVGTPSADAAGDIASLYRFTDELPAKYRAEAIQHVRGLAALVGTLQQERDATDRWMRLWEDGMSNASSEPASNAIERLREAAHAADGEWDGYDGSGVHGYDPESTCPVCVAVAAVDALYQAVREAAHSHPGIEWGYDAAGIHVYESGEDDYQGCPVCEALARVEAEA